MNCVYKVLLETGKSIGNLLISLTREEWSELHSK